jgi:hypothetical protein
VSRRLVAVLVLGAWLASLGWLAVREHERRGRTIVAGRQAVAPGAAYYRVLLDTATVGYAIVSVDTLAPTDTSPALVQFQERYFLAAGKAPRQQRYEVTALAYLRTDLRLWRASILTGAPDGVERWELAVEGDSVLSVWLGDSARRRITRTPLDTVPVPVSAVPLWLATYGAPRPGLSVRLPALDLSTLARRRAAWTVTAESTFTVPDSVVRDPVTKAYHLVHRDTVRAWRVSGVDRSAQVHAWVDENGFVLRWWTGGGLRLEREAFELALDAFRTVSDSLHGDSPLRVPATASPTDLALAPTGRHAVLLRGAEYPALEATGPTQSLAGDTARTTDAFSWRAQMAFRPLEPLPVTDPRHAADLAGAPWLSPGDSLLARTARRVTRGTANPREAATRLARWVHDSVRARAAVAGLPGQTAGEVLAARAGTPEELARLYVALARSVGLRAREVGGVIFARDGLRAHTWAEAFVGDWVPVDPVALPFPASPAHLRLVAGGAGRWTDLLPIAGGLVATGRPLPELP